ncbi:hypothetical protein LN650_14120 [Klebsiella pneumoniae subsp. pneumoniae]|nr:hypothetical protein [Klebsiella pneumoniae subsp. pneumoniae]
MGLVVKSVNGIAQYGLATFLPLYLISYGYSKNRVAAYVVCSIPGGYFCQSVLGFFGDKFGWRKTIMWVGGFGYAAVLILVWAVPVYWVIISM